MTDLDTAWKTKPTNSRYIYIAKENIIANRPLSSEFGNLNRRQSDIWRVITLGSFVEVISKGASEDKILVRVIDKSGILEDEVWSCSDYYLLRLKSVMLLPLLAVVEPSVRVELSENECLICELAAIEVGKKVILFPKTQDSRCSRELAVVRYIGPIPKMGPGTYYGLEILVIFFLPHFLILNL